MKGGLFRPSTINFISAVERGGALAKTLCPGVAYPNIFSSPVC